MYILYCTYILGAHMYILYCTYILGAHVLILYIYLILVKGVDQRKNCAYISHVL